MALYKEMKDFTNLPDAKSSCFELFAESLWSALPLKKFTGTVSPYLP